MTRKTFFLRGAPGSGSIIWGTGTRYGLEVLHECDKGVETKSQNVLEANSYVCRSYMGKTGRGGGLFTPPILNRVKVKRAQEARDNQFFFQNVQNNEIFEIFKIFKTNR